MFELHVLHVALEKAAERANAKRSPVLLLFPMQPI